MPAEPTSCKINKKTKIRVFEPCEKPVEHATESYFAMFFDVFCEDSKSKCKTLDQESPLSNSSGGGSQAARGRAASAPVERPATKVSTDKTKKETEVSLRLTNFVLSYV